MLAPEFVRVVEPVLDAAPETPPRGPLLPRGWYPACKQAAEALVALLLFVLTLPLVLLAMALVKLTSRGPVLYSQTRVGRNGRPFTLYKIRSMTYQCEDLTGATWCRPGDSRVTRVGRWLRRTHIDELPQLWNVLRGDMCLIGPRPERPEFVPQLEKAIPLYRRRLLVRPGLTGLAQVQLPPDTDLASVRRKLAYDLFYIQHLSWWMDLRIYWATLFKMLGCPFRWIRGLFAFPHRESVETLYGSWISPGLRASGHAVDHSSSNGAAKTPESVTPELSPVK